MSVCDFQGKKAYALERQSRDIAILQSHFPKAASVRKTDMKEDRAGIDYIVTLNKGAEIGVDAKTRFQGCSRFWKNGIPELALEIWSNKEEKILGWTLDTKTNVDYILFSFDPADSGNCYVIPFQLLQKAFWENGKSWVHEYRIRTQYNKGYYGEWTSWSVFVPAPVVLEAVSQAMTGGANGQ